MKLKYLGLWLVLMFAGTAQADIVTIGPTSIAEGSNSGDCTFPCMVQFQQAYDSSSFSGPLTINDISFFSVSTHSMNATYDLYIGYMDGDYTTISTDLASNRGDDYTFFDSLVLAETVSAGNVTTFSGSFDYDPTQGDLLIEIFRSAETGSNTGRFAATSGLPLSRAYEWPHGAKSSSVGYGISTQFSTSATGVPAPGALALFGFSLLGLGLRRRA